MPDEPSIETVANMLWDYIFVGGGLSASVVSNRLLHFDPSLNILVVEAGKNANNDPSIVYPDSTNLIGGEYDWKYKTVPQVHLNNRNVDLPCGKGLGGGTVINSGGWSRGNKLDFDLWAETVADRRWSYDGLLPYMKMTETAANTSINHDQHGDKGPMYIQGVASTHREFPLRKKVLDSWRDVGVDAIPHLDGNAGEPNGVGELYENRRDGRRQIASAVYPLTGITVVTNTLVSKVLIEDNTNSQRKYHATGIKLANGTSIQGKEVILSAGAVRTPQIMMLSGLGPQEELKKHGIPVKLDLPDVGQHLADHPLFPALWKIKDPSKGYAIGSGNPLFKEPQYGWGVPADYLVSTGIEDKEGLAKAIEEDEGKKPDPRMHPLLRREHTFNEHVLQYAGAPDGSTVVLALIGLLPTSRGSVKLASADINDDPLIDPNYRATAVDRFVFREGIKLQIKLAGGNATVLGREILDGELGAPGFDKPFTVDSTDEYIDKRVNAGMGSTYHPMGTSAMGKVVDTSLRVLGVAGLRIVDTSVFPVVITAHLQVATYALAERAAEIIYLQGKCNDGP